MQGPFSALKPPKSKDLEPRGTTQGRRINVLPPKQMPQRFPILLAKVKAGNTSENLLKEI